MGISVAERLSYVGESLRDSDSNPQSQHRRSVKVSRNKSNASVVDRLAYLFSAGATFTPLATAGFFATAIRAAGPTTGI